MFMPPAKSIAFLLYFAKKYWLTILALWLTVCAAEAAVGVGLPFMNKRIIDRLTVSAEMDQQMIRYLIGFFLTFILGYYGYLLTNFLQSISFARIQNDIRLKMFNYITNHSYDYFLHNFSGGLASKIRDCAIHSEGIMLTALVQITPTVVTFFITINILIHKETLIGLVTFIWLISFIYIAYQVNKLYRRAVSKYAQADSDFTGKLLDNITNIFTIKIFARRQYETVKLFDCTDRLDKCYRAQMHARILSRGIQFLLGATIMLINLYLAVRAKKLGIFGIGDVIFIFSSTDYLVRNVRFISNWYTELIGHCASIDQALGVLIAEQKEASPQIDMTNVLIDEQSKIDGETPIGGDIQFCDVKFAYGNKQPVLEHFDLAIADKSKVGIVGYSGSGKSTLISLLLKFYDVADGVIKINNLNIQDFTQDNLCRYISYIPQEPILFHRTIGENIAYGKLNATMDEVVLASKKACCYDFITEMPEGFDTLVGERGVTLSGGQRQRIAIARAILKDSPILILDEATSALDSITEKTIQVAINNLMQNKTVIAIAHRLSTLNNMDRIIVLDKGNILEDGTKDELLAHNSLFAKMWEMQKDGFSPELPERNLI